MFLATCLLDIYPDVEEKLQSTIKESLNSDSKFQAYPFGESVMVVGFFLVLIVEQLVLAAKERNQPVEMRPTSGAPINGDFVPKRRNNYGSGEHTQPTEHDALLDESYERPFRPRTGSTTSARSVTSVRSITGISNKPVRTTSVASSSRNDGDQYDASMHQDPSSHSPIRSFIMLAALSLHSVFEGLAVGLQTTVAQVLSIFGALILHKCIIAFSIGLNLVQSRLTLMKIISSNAIFCIASPLGIAIGIVLIKYESVFAGEMTSGLLQGLACGTFLYVTFFEVLPHEFNRPADRELKLFFVILGFAFVNGVLFLEMFLDKSHS